MVGLIVAMVAAGLTLAKKVEGASTIGQVIADRQGDEVAVAPPKIKGAVAEKVAEAAGYAEYAKSQTGMGLDELWQLDLSLKRDKQSQETQGGTNKALSLMYGDPTAGLVDDVNAARLSGLPMAGVGAGPIGAAATPAATVTPSKSIPSAAIVGVAALGYYLWKAAA